LEFKKINYDIVETSSEHLKLSPSMSDSNQGGTNTNHCTQRLVIFRAQTY